MQRAELGKETDVTVEGVAGHWLVCGGGCGLGALPVASLPPLRGWAPTLSFSFHRTDRRAGAREPKAAGLTLDSWSATRQGFPEFAHAVGGGFLGFRKV